MMASGPPHPPRWGLTRRLVALYLVIGIIGSAILLSLLFFQIRPTLERGLAQLHEQMALRGSAAVERFIRHLYEDMETTAAAGEIVIMEPETQQPRLERALRLHRLFSEFSVLDLQGKETVKVSRTKTFTFEELEDRSQEPCFQNAVKGQWYAGHNSFPSGKPVVVVALPIFREGIVVGVLRGVASLQELSAETATILSGRSGLAYLVDSQGRVLAHPDQELLPPGTDLRDRPVVSQVISGSPVTALHKDSFYTNQRSKRVVATAVPVQELGWGVVVETEVSDFLAPERRLLLSLSLTQAAATIIGIGALLYFSRRWLRPLAKLRGGALALASGKLEHRVHITSGDELEELGRAFNFMAERLQESLGRFRTLVEAMPDGLIAYDRERRIILVNRHLAEMLGYSEQELLGRDIFSLVAAPDREITERRVQARLRGEAAVYEFHLQHKAGSPIPVLVSAAPLRDGAGNILGGFTILADLREIKRLEEEKTKAEKMATIGQLASIVAHELRNPLGTANNALYYLRMRLGDGDPKIAWHLEAISRAVASASRIIEDLLDYARPKVPSLQPVALNSMVSDALSRSPIGENVTVVQELSPNLPPLSGDQEMLARVFLNLILNAVQAMPQGGTLRVTTRVEGEWQEATVTDTGEGIPEEVQQKLFQPLFSTRAKGMGLGLYISKDIINKHGGTITIASQPGKGTTVTVHLPQQRKEDDAQSG